MSGRESTGGSHWRKERHAGGILQKKRSQAQLQVVLQESKMPQGEDDSIQAELGEGRREAGGVAHGVSNVEDSSPRGQQRPWRVGAPWGPCC